MVGLAGGKLNAGKDVVALKEGVVGENLVVAGPGAEELQYVLHAHSLAANARPAAAFARLKRDAFKQLGVAHVGNYEPSCVCFARLLSSSVIRLLTFVWRKRFANEWGQANGRSDGILLSRQAAFAASRRCRN